MKLMKVEAWNSRTCNEGGLFFSNAMGLLLWSGFLTELYPKGHRYWEECYTGLQNAW